MKKQLFVFLLGFLFLLSPKLIDAYTYTFINKGKVALLRFVKPAAMSFQLMFGKDEGPIVFLKPEEKKIISMEGEFATRCLTSLKNTGTIKRYIPIALLNGQKCGDAIILITGSPINPHAREVSNLNQEEK